jgi:hypothetical protein
MASLAPETQLLLSCARMELAPVAQSRLTALQATDLDWDIVLDEADRHGLIPLLHRHAAVLHPPAWAAHRLDREFAVTARRSPSLTTELVDVMTALRAANVSATPFKGPALAVAAYGSVVLRQFDNLDVLVHRASVGAADRVLVGANYRPVVSGLESRPSRHVRSYARGDVTLRLHSTVGPRCVSARGSVTGLWTRRRPVELGEVRLSAPSPEDHLLLVTLHAAQGMWGRLGWLADVVALRDRYPALDHFAVRYEARRHGVERLVRLSLGLAQALMDAPLPREIAAWVRRDRGLDRLVRDVCARRLCPGAAAPGLLEAMQFHLRSREHWSDRARYVARGAGAALTLPARLAARATSELRQRSRRVGTIIPAFHR